MQQCIEPRSHLHLPSLPNELPSHLQQSRTIVGFRYMVRLQLSLKTQTAKYMEIKICADNYQIGISCNDNFKTLNCTTIEWMDYISVAVFVNILIVQTAHSIAMTSK